MADTTNYERVRTRVVGMHSGAISDGSVTIAAPQETSKHLLAHNHPINRPNMEQELSLANNPKKKEEVRRQVQEHIRRSTEWQKEARQDPYYRFVMIVAGLTNTTIERYFTSVASDPVPHNTRQRTNTVHEQLDAKLSNVISNVHKRTANELEYVQDILVDPVVSGEMLLSPFLFAHIAQAENLLTGHASEWTAKDFITASSREVMTIFAELVSVGINLSRITAPTRYTDKSNFKRLTHRQKQIVRKLSHVYKNHQNRLLEHYPPPKSTVSDYMFNTPVNY
jgi:hypothetical protein